MNDRAASRILLPILCVCLTSCGGAIKTQAPSYSSIEGNWKLIGQGSAPGALPTGPYIGVVIGVDGDTLYANVDNEVPCSSGNSAIGGSGGAAKTTITDGNFQIFNASAEDSIQFLIKGTVPVNGSATWQGTYELYNSSTTSCTFNLSGSFTASLYLPLQGTYSGTIKGSDLGSGVSLSLDLSQGDLPVMSTGPANPLIVYLPLTGTASVSGSPCFTSGTIVSGPDSFVAGDRFQIVVLMGDGSTIFIRGWYSEQNQKALEPVLVVVKNGQCNGATGNGTLTLQ